jgi:hypothetical protein
LPIFGLPFLVDPRLKSSVGLIVDPTVALSSIAINSLIVLRIYGRMGLGHPPRRNLAFPLVASDRFVT